MAKRPRIQMRCNSLSVPARNHPEHLSRIAFSSKDCQLEPMKQSRNSRRPPSESCACSGWRQAKLPISTNQIALLPVGRRPANESRTRRSSVRGLPSLFQLVVRGVSPHDALSTSLPSSSEPDPNQLARQPGISTATTSDHSPSSAHHPPAERRIAHQE